MTTRTSRFPVVSKRRRPAQLGSAPAAMIFASLLAVAAFFQPSAHAATPSADGKAEAAVARSSDKASKIAELEKGFWVCDYLGTTRGVDESYGVTCGANYEELKQTKFSGDFDALVQWWRVNKAAQHKALASEQKALESEVSAPY